MIINYYFRGKCAENKIRTCIQHTNQERIIEGTWVSLEINTAIEKGYELTDILEVWHWKETAQYDKQTKTGGLFTEYINNALILKLQASGYPPGAETEQDRENYIRRVFDHEGILLDKQKISYNPGMRAIAKLLLTQISKQT